MLLSLFFKYKIMSSENREIQDDLEAQKKLNKETKDNLLDFWKNSDNDKKILENPKAWENAVNAIKWDIEEKTKNINDPKSKAKIDEKLKWLEKYSKLWKLNQIQAQELSDIYKEISAIEWTEHAEDAKQWKEAQKAIEAKAEEYMKKLDIAMERLDKLLASHNEEAQKKVESDLNKSKEARNIPQEQPPSLDDFPSSQKESPKA